MAERMAGWVAEGWRIQTEADLDRYTYGVAGAAGVLLCDLWAWAEGEQLHRSAAIQFGRGLQAVNILRNRAEDLLVPWRKTLRAPYLGRFQGPLPLLLVQRDIVPEPHNRLKPRGYLRRRRYQ